jgi:hypothetical protein
VDTCFTAAVIVLMFSFVVNSVPRTFFKAERVSSKFFARFNDKC